MTRVMLGLGAIVDVHQLHCCNLNFKNKVRGRDVIVEAAGWPGTGTNSATPLLPPQCMQLMTNLGVKKRFLAPAPTEGHSLCHKTSTTPLLFLGCFSLDDVEGKRNFTEFAAGVQVVLAT